MNVRFEMKTPPDKTDPDGNPIPQQPTEYVTLITGFDGKDEVSRVATDEDRAKWPEAYAAFKAGDKAPAKASAPSAAPAPVEPLPESPPGPEDEVKTKSFFKRKP